MSNVIYPDFSPETRARNAAIVRALESEDEMILCTARIFLAAAELNLALAAFEKMAGKDGPHEAA